MRMRSGREIAAAYERNERRSRRFGGQELTGDPPGAVGLLRSTSVALITATDPD
jgi:hypothetical protein